MVGDLASCTAQKSKDDSLAVCRLEAVKPGLPHLPPPNKGVVSCPAALLLGGVTSGNNECTSPTLEQGGIRGVQRCGIDTSALGNRNGRGRIERTGWRERNMVASNKDVGREIRRCSSCRPRRKKLCCWRTSSRWEMASEHTAEVLVHPQRLCASRQDYYPLAKVQGYLTNWSGLSQTPGDPKHLITRAQLFGVIVNRHIRRSYSSRLSVAAEAQSHDLL